MSRYICPYIAKNGLSSPTLRANPLWCNANCSHRISCVFTGRIRLVNPRDNTAARSRGEYIVMARHFPVILFPSLRVFRKSSFYVLPQVRAVKAFHWRRTTTEHEIDIVSQVGNIQSTVVVVVELFRADGAWPAAKQIVHIVGQIGNVHAAVMIGIPRMRTASYCKEILVEEIHGICSDIGDS